MTSNIHTGSLRPNELEVVYAISRIVAETIDIEEALNNITILARQVLIFDSAVLYQIKENEGGIEPLFARAIGRGSSTPEKLNWGDMAAGEVIKHGQNSIFQAEENEPKNRLEQQFILGLPMQVGGQVVGALIFIRFGGPPYSEQHINLAEFIATHITHLFERQRLVERVANLEADRRLALLQENFIAMVTHDLNTPLGFIKGYTTTLLREDTNWDEQTRKEFLTIIDEETDRLSELIENLLDGSRLQAGTLPMTFKPQDLNELVSNNIERLQSRYNNIQIKIKPTDETLTAKVDAKRFAQVLENLVSNAAKYAPHKLLTLFMRKNQNMIQIAVQDQGPGIAEQHLEQIFERFYRVPERSGGVRGTGLGLFICREIIKAHQGEIKVKSKLNQGTTFFINIPAFEEGKEDAKNE